jgi:HD-like signal output (HDOD) protein
MDTLSSLIKGIKGLPSLPAVAVKIIELLKKDTASVAEIAGIISYDPGLTAKMLRVANSSYFAPPYKVDSVESAVNIMGLNNLKTLALSFIIVKDFRKQAMDNFDHDLFWKRAISAAISAEVFARHMGMGKEDFFVTSLLMDIGALVMYLCKSEDYIKVLEDKMNSQISLAEAELAIFGFDHARVGSEILKEWGLPENIYMPIAYHCNESGSPEEIRKHVEILMLADLSASLYYGRNRPEKFIELRSYLKDRLGLAEDEGQKLMDSIAEKLTEILIAFEMNADVIKPYSQLLEEAQAELGQLN